MNPASDVKDRWPALAAKYSATKEQAVTLWHEIEKNYSAPGRFYHTLEHIGKLLELFNEFKPGLTDPDAVEFAIWYHDIIYVPGRGDNETKSAELAEKRLEELGVDENRIRTVIQLIDATKTHRLNEAVDNFDGRFFLDADLSVLGTDWKTYLHYTQQIREEFSHVPELAYRLGRSGVLKQFLSRERIYKTDEFYDLFEKKARENIERELKLLGT